MDTESTESFHSCEAEPRSEFQLSFAFSTSVDHPCFVLPNQINRQGTASNPVSSLYLSHSDRKTLAQFDLEEQKLNQIAEFDSSLTSLCSFPSSSQLLATQEKRAFILDPREKLVIASILPSRSVTQSAFSSSSFQLYTSRESVDCSFLSGSNGIDVFDSRMLCRPHSQIHSSSSLCLFSDSPNALVQVTARRSFEFESIQDGVYHWVLLGDSWTRTDRWENKGERWDAALAERKENELVIACSSRHTTQIVKGMARRLQFDCECVWNGVMCSPSSLLVCESLGEHDSFHF